MAMKTKCWTVDEYLETLSEDKRAALENLRKAIKAAQKRRCRLSLCLPRSTRLSVVGVVGFGILSTRGNST